MFNNLPRTGIPPDYQSWAELQRSVGVLVDLGMIERSSEDLVGHAALATATRRSRCASPTSHRVPRTRSRSPPVTQCILPMLWRLRIRNQRWRIYDRVAAGREPVARAAPRLQRGADRFRCEQDRAVPAADGRAHRDDRGGCRCPRMPCRGRARADDRHRRHLGPASARAVAAEATATGADQDQAMAAVVEHLIEEFHHDL